MRVLTRLYLGSALGLIATQSLALTGEEVWANQTAYLSPMGITVSQTQSRAGNILTVSDIAYDIVFPFGVGSMSIRSGPQTYTENADGTVAVDYGPTNALAISATFQPDDYTKLGLSANLQVDMTGQTMVASGTAADVTYVSTVDLLEITLMDYTLTGAPDVQGLTMDFYLSMADTTSTTQITTGADTTFRTTSSTGTTISDYSFGVGEDFSTKAVSQQLGVDGTVVVTLPGGPMNLMNMSQALRDGLAVEVTLKNQTTRSQTVTMSFGEMISNQSTNLNAANSVARFNATGLAISGGVAGFDVEMPVIQGLPFPVSASGGAVDYNFAFPVNASDQPADVRYAFGLRDIIVNDAVWAMVDAGATLPHDPLSLNIDLAGKVKLLVDLLDIESMTQTINSGVMPFDLQSVAISDLSASGLGVSATGSGDFMLDMTDMTTFDGFPRPTGQATATIDGLNGLLDKLIGLGLLAQSEVMTARLGMTMFLKPSGDDQVQGTVEFTPDGHIIANGQRIQ